MQRSHFSRHDGGSSLKKGWLSSTSLPLAAIIAAMAISQPALANGGDVTNGSGGASGLGGVDSTTGAGGNGATGPDSSGSGGGAGVGAGGAGGAGGFFGGAGGAGGVHGVVVNGVDIGAASAGTDGGNGASGAPDGGGGGGAGGYGAVVSGTVGVNAAVTGGNGGSGGLGSAFRGGGGGSGGYGVFLNTGGVLTNNSTITGGNGGGGAYLGPGPSGAGVFGDAGGVSIINNGTIVGGAGANAITFAGGANALTLGAGTLTGNIGVNGGGSVNFNDAAGASTLANVITGNGSIEKTGAATLNLTGVNTYSGSTTISAGVLGANSTASLGDGSATNTLIFNGGSLQTLDNMAFAATRSVSVIGSGTIDTAGNTLSIAGVISGAGALTKSGAGILALSGNNAGFSGGITVAAGTLSLQNDNAAGTGAITTTGSVIDYANGVTIANPIVISSNTTQLQTLTGVTATQSGVISEDVAGRPLEKIGAGTLILSGANTYTGATTITDGALSVAADNNLGAGGPLVFNGGSLRTTASFTSARAVTANAPGAIFSQSSGAVALTLTGVVSGAGAVVQNGPGQLVLQNAGNAYLGGTVVNGGAVAVGSDGALGNAAGGLTLNNNGGFLATASFATARAITLNGTGGIAVAGGETLTANGVIGGAGALNFNGAGTLTLGAANTYAGGTTVTGGVLNANAAGSLSTGAVAVNGGSLNNNAANSVASVSIGAGGALTNSSVLTSAAPIQNAGTFTTTVGSVTNGGLVNSNQVNAGGGAINGAITNMGSGVFAVTGAVVAGSTFDNIGSAQLNVNAGGSLTGVTTLTNSAAVNVSGALTANTVVNSSAVNVNAGGVLTAAGGLTNTTSGVVTVAAGGTVNDDLNNAGLVDNSGIYNAVVASNTGTINNNATGVWTGNVVSSSGVINNAGVWNGSLVNSGTFAQTAGVLSNGLTNTGTVNASGGAINGAIANNAGVFNVNGSITNNNNVFTNAAGARLNLVAGTFSGLNALNNSGAVTFDGSRSLGAANIVNNGVLAATAPGNVLTTTGSLTGNGVIAAQIAGGTVSVVNATGGASAGSQTITFNNGVRTTAVLLANPLPVLNLGGGTLTVANTGLIPNLSNGFANNYLVQNGPGGNATIQSQLNAAPISGVATSLSGVISSLTTGFFQAASAIVSRPEDPRPNQIGGGPFIRISAGDSRTKLTGAAIGGGIVSESHTKTSMDFSGFQVGADLGVYNINNTGWNFNFGAFGGVAETSAKGVSVTPSPGGGSTVVNTSMKVKVPYVALYSFLSNGPFTAEVNVRRDFYDGTVASEGLGVNFVNPNTSLKGLGLSVNANMSYRVPVFETWYVEPLIGVSKGRYTFSNVQLASAPNDQMAFNPTSSWLGRAGVNVGTNFVVSDKLVLAPFVHASVWREFAGDSKAQAQVAGLSFDVATQRVGTFGQVGAGLQFKVLDTALLGFVRGDVRFGEKANGKAVNVGLKMQF